MKRPGPVMKTPNTKIQTPGRKLEAPNSKHQRNMKLIPLLMVTGCLAVCAETEEQINKRFAVQPGGKVVVDVDFGSIDVSTNATGEVTVDVYRKVSRRSKPSEE